MIIDKYSTRRRRLPVLSKFKGIGCVPDNSKEDEINKRLKEIKSLIKV